MNRSQMGVELMTSLTQIDEQINAVEIIAAEMSIEASLVRDQHGNFLLAPLVVSRAQVVFGLALLQPATKEHLDATS